MPDQPTRDTTIDQLLIQKIDSVEHNLTGRLHDQGVEFNRRLDAQDRALQDIQKQTRLTNGRVTSLEKDKARGQGMISAFRWVPPVITAMVTAGLTILTMTLTGGLH